MALDQAMIVAGIVAGVGCRRGTPAPEIEAAIHAALAKAGLAAGALGAIATIGAKHDEAGIEAAAARFGVGVVLVSDSALKSAGGRTQTKSERVLALTGVPSVAEAAALAAAGPSARLIGPRLAVGSATCALAIAEAESGSLP
jgi:cobalt-precorrin 5A hydrolase